MADDNRSPMCAFLWANKLSRLPRCDIQCNHLWSDATNVNLYTSLSNLCLTPSFLAKLTDTDSGIKMLLRYRAYEIYNGFFPPNETCPIKPADYDALVWSDSASEVFNAEQQLRNEMRTKPLDRVVISARKLGWIFSNYQPDTTL